MHSDNGFFISFQFMHIYICESNTCFFILFIRFVGWRLVFLIFHLFVSLCCSFWCAVHTHTCGGQCATQNIKLARAHTLRSMISHFPDPKCNKNMLLSAPHESHAINNTVSFEEICTTNHITYTHTLTRVHHAQMSDDDKKMKKKCDHNSILLFFSSNDKFKLEWFFFIFIVPIRGKLYSQHTMHVIRGDPCWNKYSPNNHMNNELINDIFDKCTYDENHVIDTEEEKEIHTQKMCRYVCA